MLDLLQFIPCWARFLLACAILTFGATWGYTGYRDYEAIEAEQKATQMFTDPYALQSAKGRFQGGLVLTLAGTVLLALSGRSASEKNGYRSC